MRAYDVMKTTLVTISPDHSVWHAAYIMLAERVSSLPVLDDGRSVNLVQSGCDVSLG